MVAALDVLHKGHCRGKALAAVWTPLAPCGGGLLRAACRCVSRLRVRDELCDRGESLGAEGADLRPSLLRAGCCALLPGLGLVHGARQPQPQDASQRAVPDQETRGSHLSRGWSRTPVGQPGRLLSRWGLGLLPRRLRLRSPALLGQAQHT